MVVLGVKYVWDIGRNEADHSLRVKGEVQTF